MENKTYYSISQINEFIKLLFDNTEPFKDICLKGEISNFKGANRSGHLYFTLKDEKSSINAVLFKFDALRLKFTPKNGDEVIVRGSISSYPPSGTYQIICKSIESFGIGQLLLKKEELKKKLFAEGLFDEEHKKSLPKFPKKIAIITGKNSAAAIDFKFNIERRYPICEIKLFYSLVQGENAPKDLIRNLFEAVSISPDIILIGRGGGASEDLNAFDDENLVREIYNCKIPIISAVGHQINQTLCDLVADKYASTPTGAAELAVPDINEIIEDLKYMDNFISSEINRKINTCEREIKYISESKYFVNVLNLFDSYKDRINIIEEKIENQIKNKVISKEKELKYIENHLESLNPNNILSKGYSIIYKDGKAISDITELKKEDNINIKIKGGEVTAKIEEVKENGE